MFLKKTVIIRQNEQDLSFALDLESIEGLSVKFTGPAAFFLNCLDKKMEKQKIIKQTVLRYQGVSAKQAEKDFISFIKDLKKFNFLEMAK